MSYSHAWVLFRKLRLDPSCLATGWAFSSFLNNNSSHYFDCGQLEEKKNTPTHLSHVLLSNKNQITYKCYFQLFVMKDTEEIVHAAHADRNSAKLVSAIPIHSALFFLKFL